MVPPNAIVKTMGLRKDFTRGTTGPTIQCSNHSQGQMGFTNSPRSVRMSAEAGSETAGIGLGSKVGEVRFGKLGANPIVIPLLMVVVGILMGIAISLYYARDLGLEGGGSWEWAFLLFFVPYVVVHELLHAAAFLYWGKVPPGTLRFGFSWKAFMAYCHSSHPVPVSAYRISLLLPLYVTCVLGIPILLIHPSIGTAALMGIAISGCVGDIWVFWGLRKFDRDFLVKDHRTDAGCDIFLPASHDTEAWEEHDIEASRGAQTSPGQLERTPPPPPSLEDLLGLSSDSKLVRHLDWLVRIPIPGSVCILASYAFALDLGLSMLLLQSPLDAGTFWNGIRMALPEWDPSVLGGPMLVHPLMEMAFFIWLPVRIARLFTGRGRVLILISAVVFSAAHGFTGLSFFATGLATGFALAFSYVYWSKAKSWWAFWVASAVYLLHNTLMFALMLVVGN